MWGIPWACWQVEGRPSDAFPNFISQSTRPLLQELGPGLYLQDSPALFLPGDCSSADHSGLFHAAGSFPQGLSACLSPAPEQTPLPSAGVGAAHSKTQLGYPPPTSDAWVQASHCSFLLMHTPGRQQAMVEVMGSLLIFLGDLDEVPGPSPALPSHAWML